MVVMPAIFHGLRRSRQLALVLPVLIASPVRAQEPAAPEPQISAIDDPLLAEPAAAPREITSWDEALQMIREHSPDYLGSAEAVRRAEAQKTVALSAVLPS